GCVALHEFGGKCWKAAIVTIGKTEIQLVVSILNQPVVTHALSESVNKNRRRIRTPTYEKPNQRPLLLRQRIERPRHGAAHQRDEIASSHCLHEGHKHGLTIKTRKRHRAK